MSPRQERKLEEAGTAFLRAHGMDKNGKPLASKNRAQEQFERMFILTPHGGKVVR